MLSHPSAFVSTFHFLNLLLKKKTKIKGFKAFLLLNLLWYRRGKWKKCPAVNFFFHLSWMQCLHQTRPFFLAERVPEFKQFCHLSPLPPIRSNRSLGPARRSSCLPEDALPHAWVGSPYAGRVVPLVGRLFPPHMGRHPSPHLGDLTHT